MTSRGTYPPEDDEDTIELEVSAEEIRGLSKAAQESQAGAAISERKSRFHLWPETFAVALVGVAAAIAWRAGPTHRIAPLIAPTPVVPSPRPAAAAPAVLAEPQEPRKPQGPPVRMQNPFDATEVFEFPAGTTRAEAQQKVSELLLQRAVDRGSAGN